MTNLDLIKKLNEYPLEATVVVSDNANIRDIQTVQGSDQQIKLCFNIPVCATCHSVTCQCHINKQIPSDCPYCGDYDCDGSCDEDEDDYEFDDYDEDDDDYDDWDDDEDLDDEEDGL